MDAKFREVLFSVIAGDAAGYTLGGMSKGHINSFFKEEIPYPDPIIALKGNKEKWKKPSYYSSISQFMILAALSCNTRGFSKERFVEYSQKAIGLTESANGVFRDCSTAERAFLDKIQSSKASLPYTRPCSRIIPIVTPLVLISSEEVFLEGLSSLVSLFTLDSSTLACSLIYATIVRALAKNISESPWELAVKSLTLCKEIVEQKSAIFFSNGFNSDHVIEDIKSLLNLFEKLQNLKTIEQCEKLICDHGNKSLTNKITRGTVNLPMVIFPYSFSISAVAEQKEKIIYLSAREGGFASVLASLSSVLTTAFYGIDVPQAFRDNLANKKRINSILDIISQERVTGAVILDFLEGEKGLTLKEEEEFKAKNKTQRDDKVAKKQNRRDIEAEMSKHIVESWTKIDKAKWRKERKKQKL